MYRRIHWTSASLLPAALSFALFLLPPLLFWKNASLAHASYAVMLADDHPDAFLAPAPSAVVLADARPAALLAVASSAVMRALCLFRLHSFTACTTTAHSYGKLLLLVLVAFRGRGTLSLLHGHLSICL